jgi:hypothetical protein
MHYRRPPAIIVEINIITVLDATEIAPMTPPAAANISAARKVSSRDDWQPLRFRDDYFYMGQ